MLFHSGTLGSMPRIDAATVAEHREHQLHLLLEAAAALVAERDLDQLTIAAVAKRSGRSRASVYAYFGSTDDMRTALSRHIGSGWSHAVVEELRVIGDPVERLDRLIALQIDSVFDPSVDRVLTFCAAQQRTGDVSGTDEIMAPVRSELMVILGQLGVSPANRAAVVVQGAIAAAIDLVRDGAAFDETVRDTQAFVRAGLAALERRTAVDDSSTTARGQRDAAALDRVVRSAAASAQTAGDDNARRRAGHIALAQMLCATAAFVSGATGLGGTAWHLVLGASLIVFVGLAACGAALLQRRPVTPNSIPVLIAASTLAALVAGAGAGYVALAAHVGFAALVIAGLWSTVRSALFATGMWHVDAPRVRS